VAILFGLACGFGLAAATKVEVRLASSEADVEEHTDGQVNRTSSDLQMAFDATDDMDQIVGLRFDGVMVPPGATITNAFLQFTVDEVSSEPTSLRIEVEAADDAEALSGHLLSISSRARAASSVDWAPKAWLVPGEADLPQQTPNLAPLIQEVVSRPGWQPGNALAFVISGIGRRVGQSFDGNPAGAPLLVLEYDDSVSVDSFKVDRAMIKPGEEIMFSWLVSDIDRERISCDLDVEDDGFPDYTFPDCELSLGQAHAYPVDGFYTARLIATDPNGIRSSATALVRVQIPKSVTVAAAGAIACDPQSRHFNGGSGTENFCRMRAVSDLMLGMELNAVLALGDIQYESATYESFLASYHPSWGRLKDITFPATGNHEYRTPGAAGYYQYFGPAAGDPAKGYYSFDLGNWHIVALNTQCSKVGGCKIDSPQVAWLKADLAANPSHCTLAYWHEPRFSSGPHGNSDKCRVGSGRPPLRTLRSARSCWDS
jgi:hypothetical protein